MVSKSKTRTFDGNEYTIALVADSKRGAQVRAKKIRDSGGFARITIAKRSGGILQIDIWYGSVSF